MENFNNNFSQACVHGDAPFCATACPFDLDVRDFISKVSRGNLGAAYKLYRQAVVFPAVVSRLCDSRCAAACPRCETDAAVRLRELELAAVTGSTERDRQPAVYNLPLKQQRVAVIGGGPCGLAFAIRLAAKRYPVTIFEKGRQLGGSLLTALDPELVRGDIELQSHAAPFTVCLEQEITTLEQLPGDYQAIFIATGAGGSDLGCRGAKDSAIHRGSRAGVFLGGQLCGGDLLSAIHDGARASVDVEKFLKLGTDNFQPELIRPSRLPRPRAADIRPQPAIEPAAPHGPYTKDEAAAEAGRCLKCDCRLCYDSCEFMQYYRRYPHQLANAIDFGLRLDNIESHSSNRMVNACSDCGLCGAVCPAGVDCGHQTLLARRQMFEQGQIPAAYHDYLLRDMEHALSERAFLSLPAPTGHTSYAFFPGCQLTASDGEYTPAAYELLRRVEPDLGLLAACCGAPARWAGDAEREQQVLRQLRQAWVALGQPVLVLACASCARQLRRAWPEATCVDMWSVLRRCPDAAWPVVRQPARDKKFALADPCAARDDPAWGENVRAVLDRLGVNYAPMAANSACCGFGGDIAVAQPELRQSIVAARLRQSELPYICYCANCRDSYAQAGRPALHVLDLLLGRMSDRQPPDLTSRRRNREWARQQLAGSAPGEVAENAHIRLEISANMRGCLDEQRVTEDDVREVLAHAAASGRWIEAEGGRCIAHRQIGAFTLWVEYHLTNGSYTVDGVYHHRMTVAEPERA